MTQESHAHPRHPFRLALLSLSLLGLSGCLHYQAKPLDPQLTAQRFQQRTLDSNGLHTFLQQQGKPLPQWPLPHWGLPQLTLAALYFHPDLDAARALWQQAQANQQRSAQRANPQFAFTPTFNAANSIPSPWILSSLLNFSYQTAGKREIRQQQAAQLSEKARLTLAAQVWQIRSNLRQQLEALWFAQQQEQILQQQQTLKRESLRRIEQQYAAGNISALELARVRLAPEQSHLALLDVQQQVNDRRIQLAAALGLYPEALQEIRFNFSQLDEIISDADLSQARSRALQNHAQLLQSLSAYAASEAQLELAVAQQYPDIQIGPGYEYDQGGNKWSLGLGFTLPLFHNQAPQIAQAAAQRRVAAAQFESQQLKVVQQVAQAVAAYRAAQQKKAATDQIQTDIKQQLQRSKAQLQVGELSQADLLAVRLQLNSANLAQLNAAAALQKARGQVEDATQTPLKFPAQSWQQNPRPDDNGDR